MISKGRAASFLFITHILDLSQESLWIRHDKENWVFGLTKGVQGIGSCSWYFTTEHLRFTVRTLVLWRILQFSFQKSGNDLIIIFPSCYIVGQEFGVFSQEVLPVTGDVIHLQMVYDELASPFSNFLSNIIICFYKLQQLLDIGEVCFNWDVVNPWL